MLKEITIKCCLAYTEEEFKDVVEAFVAGKYYRRVNRSLLIVLIGRFKGIQNMVTSKVHIDDIVSKGFDELVTNRDQHVKILITPKNLRG